MRLKARCLLYVFLVIFAFNSSSVASTLALDVTSANSYFGGTGTTTEAWSVGWEFSVNSPIRVDALGIFAIPLSQSANPTAAHIGIWDSGGNLVTSWAFTVPSSVSVASALASTLPGASWDFDGSLSYSPVVLSPGTYVIGAGVVIDQSGFGNLYSPVMTDAAIATIPEITYVASRATLNPATFAEPGTFSGFGTAFFGPSFLATPVTVPVGTPEPTSIVMLASGLVGIAKLITRNSNRLGPLKPSR